MCELKATTVYDAYWTANSTGQGTGVQVYLKSEADKVIAELKTRLSAERSAKVDYKISARDLSDGLREALAEIRYQKYKRCLAMANWCKSKQIYLHSLTRIYSDKEFWEYASDYWIKWSKCWLKIAEQFKEAK